MIRKLWNRIWDIGDDEDRIYRRIRRYGTRGIVHVTGPEDDGISVETVQYLVPAESEAR